MRSPVRLTIVALVGVLLTLAGCAETTSSTSSSPAGSKAVVEPGTSVDYDFTATTLDGDTFNGASLENKPAVLWFWSPWCPTCRAQSGAVSRLAQKYEGDVAVIGVGGLDDKPAIRDLATKIPHVTHLVDDKGVVWKHFGVTDQSTYTVIGADGEIESEGYLDDDALAALVAKLAG